MMQPGIKYELESLEKLIQRSLDCDVSPQLAGEVDRIKQSLTQGVLGLTDELHLGRYIRHHQQALISLSDSTPQIGAVLDDLLTFLKTQFPRYFDLDANVPAHDLETATKNTRSKLNCLFKRLTDAKADSLLVELAFQVMERVYDAVPKRVTYRRLSYAQEVQRGLQELLDRIDKVTNVNEELRLLFYYLNLNSVQAVAYHARFVGSSLKDIPSRIDRIERLSLLRKEINQAQVKPGIAYNSHAKPLTTQVSIYISEEINHLEKMEALGRQHSFPDHKAALSDFRIQMQASVSQLAYLIKLFLETALIQNKNRTELLQGLATFMVTKRTQVVSFDSLRAKYYNVESGTKLAVRQMLTDMIRHIDEDLR